MVKYTRFKAHKRGIDNGQGGTKSCMHCGKQATISAVSTAQGTKLVLYVCFCDEHAEYAKSLQ